MPEWEPSMEVQWLFCRPAIDCVKTQILGKVYEYLKMPRSKKKRGTTINLSITGHQFPKTHLSNSLQHDPPVFLSFPYRLTMTSSALRLEWNPDLLPSISWNDEGTGLNLPWKCLWVLKSLMRLWKRGSVYKIDRNPWTVNTIIVFNILN